jgi:3-dehydroquinate synthase
MLDVSLGTRSYTIQFGSGNLSRIGSICKKLNLSGSSAVITNATIGALYGKSIIDSLAAVDISAECLIIPDGEQFKNSSTLNSIYDVLIERGLDRKSFLIALGGGVVGDITGFAAATYLRGIEFIQVPTSLLAQVDSSVGGKTGINHLKGKNLIGAFHQPRSVLVDISTLDTLPEREYLSGLAEVIKYGVVCDRDFFHFISERVDRLLDREQNTLLEVVSRSCAIKAGVVANDEREDGYRAVLNYGHTFAHAVERLTEYKRFLHGEAVAIGMVQACKLSEYKGYADSSDTKRLIDLLQQFGLPVDLPSFTVEAYLQAIRKDKKVNAGGINFVFNSGIGGSVIEAVADWDFLLSTIRAEVGK